MTVKLLSQHHLEFRSLTRGYTGSSESCQNATLLEITGHGLFSGLDPAGPYFRDEDILVRLDPNDATFVDVIHTDGEPLSDLGNLKGRYFSLKVVLLAK